MTFPGKIVYFDLETTGLDTSVCEILQLAAVCENRVFNVYVLPQYPINPRAAQITGLSVVGGRLYCKGVMVPTITLYEALTSFLSFLCSFHCPLLLAAHNAEDFDIPILRRVLQQHGLLQEIKMVVPKYLDTLPLSRDLYPQLERHSLEHLSKVFIKKQHVNAHDAVEDAKVLQLIIQYMSPSKWNTSNYIYPL